jgi:type II secretory pathway component GspD/PulD (secretin)
MTWAPRKSLTRWGSSLFGLVCVCAYAQQSPVTPQPQPQVTIPVGGGVVQSGTQGDVRGSQGIASDARGAMSAQSTVTTPEGGGMDQPVLDQGSRSATGTPSQPSMGVRTVGAGARRAPASIGEQDWQPMLDNEVPEAAVPDEGQSISINGSVAIPVIEVLDQLQLATGWSIISSPGLEELSVRFWAENVSPRVLLKILREKGIYYEFDADTNLLYVMHETEYLEREYGKLTPAEFTIQHADVIDMESQLRALMSPAGKMIPDPRTGQILVWDTQDNLEAMNEAVLQLDVPLEPQVFPIQYLSADALLDSISAILSERGVAHADPITNTIIVSDLPTRQSQIAKMLASLDVKLDSRTWTLSYAAPEDLAERLEGVLPEDTGFISTDEDTHQITVQATTARIDEIDALITAWDVRQQQVEIAAFLVTADVDVMRSFGIDWSYFGDISGVPVAFQRGSSSPNYTAPGPDSGQRASIGRLPYQEFLRDPITGARRVFLDDSDGNGAAPDGDEFILDPRFKGNRVAAVLDYLDQTDDLDILARPRVTVQDGEEALFQRIQQRAYQSFGFNTGGVVTGTDTTNINVNRVSPGRVEFVEVGVVLKVLPRINDDGKILLEIEAEDSDANDRVLVSAGLESTVPEKVESKVETEVLVHSGDTIVIGGLRTNSFENMVDQMPLLGDIPLLGRLFRTSSRDHREREFIVFITPTIRNEFTQAEAERLAAYDEASKDSIRHAQKKIWGRAGDRLAKGKNELSVAIGQEGDLFSEGAVVTLETLSDKLRTAADRKPKPLVVLRVHHEAPPEIVDEIKAAAEAVGLEVELEDSLPPIVPSFPPGWETREIPGE